MSERNDPPRSAGVLTKWVDAFARERGLTSKRVRDWVSYMVLGGHLEKRCRAEGGPRFFIKGAVALEMRIPSKARATKDIDFIVDDLGDENLTEALREALTGEYQGFTFRVKGAPYVMPNDSVRAEVVLDYKGRSWGTVQVDMSPREGEQTEVELIEPLDLEPFGLATPDALPCLSLRYHVAHKVHAMTAPPRNEDAPNERFRDLVDALMIREILEDLGGVRAACVEVFSLRGTHGWPPRFSPPESWQEPFRQLASEVDLPVRNLEQAVVEAREFIQMIDGQD
jgi:nucleotidyltransferase AbiEii toxin of type IV toxin-antitoxin system